MTTLPRIRPFAALLLLGVALAACSTRQTTPQTRTNSGMASMAPMLSVERFLQSANSRNYRAMADLFGTYRGPVDYDRRQVEREMELISEILQHEDYEIVSDRVAPGREHPTNRVGVNIRKDGRMIPDVAFMVVQSEAGAWLVEQIELEKITGG